MSAGRTRADPEETVVQLQAGPLALEGNLAIPEGARGIVVFAHGGGSSRFSPRNRYVAGELRKAGLATLLFDLLTEKEEAIDEVTRELRFDIRLLAERMVGATEWIKRTPSIAGLKLGYFGASTGAAAALVAAAKLPDEVGAIVSRGGRPDLAAPHLGRVKAPTLLIVGSWDGPVIEMNREAMAQMACQKELVIVPGASHLFEEPGKLEEVARLASDWFAHCLGGADKVSRPVGGHT
jgi:pimeloyl-ACP methyl ester carboxylesterase